MELNIRDAIGGNAPARRGGRRFRWRLGCLVVAFLLAPSPSAAAINGDVGLLRNTVATYRENLGRLRTWQARVALTSRTVGSPHLPPSSGAMIDYAYDRRRAATAWHWVSDESSPNPGPPGSPRDPVGGLRTSELGGTAHIGLIPRRSLAEPKVAQIFPEGERKPGLTPDDLDPLLFFTNQREVGGLLDHYIDVAESPRVNHTSVVREGELVVVTVDSPKLLTRFEFDASKGGNLVRFLSDSKDPKGRKTEWRCVYETYAEVCVPSEILRDRLNRATNEEAHIEYHWLENKVNEPVPGGSFTLEAMGVRPGDIVSDNRAHVEFIYGADEKGPQSPHVLWLVAANLFAVVILCGAAWWTRRRRRTT